ncbi:MAG: dihydropteroate synthase [Verrucomicrobiales bacterium]
MGVLNVTPDSFSDGGDYSDRDRALAHALAMVAEGADIIDIGGESTRPGAAEVGTEEELRRTIPVVEALAARSPALISIDTSKPEVARAALAAGAHIVNDVTGLRDPAMRQAVADFQAGACVMHMRGTPRTMQDAPRYTDVVAEVRAYFEAQLAACAESGIALEQIALDPGIGFGKTLDHNLALLRHLPDLRAGGRPLLLGISRKSFIGKLLGDERLASREWPTAALSAWLRLRGAEIHRVHDARRNAEAVRMAEATLP